MKHNITTLLAAFVMCVTIVATYVSGAALMTNMKEMQTSLSVRDISVRLLSEVLDAETGQRGYLLTGDEKYLHPYYAAMSVIPTELAAYGALALDEKQRIFVSEITPLVQGKINELSETISIRRERGIDPALKVVMTDQGQDAMNELRQRFKIERNRATAVRRNLTQAGNALTYMTLGSFFIGLCALIVFIFALRSARIDERALRGARDVEPMRWPS